MAFYNKLFIVPLDLEVLNFPLIEKAVVPGSMSPTEKVNICFAKHF